MEVVNYLTQRGMKTSLEDYEGFSILARVLDVFDFSLALKLLQRGCDIDFTNKDGRTVLTLFIQKRSTAVV